MLEGERHRIALELEAIDLFDCVARERGRRRWDLLVAHVFLDEVDISPTVPLLLTALRKGGLFYFSMNFDGVTIIEPVVHEGLDALIEHLYHETMDERTLHGMPCGDSRTGRHLLACIKNAGAEILDVGGSDWVVFPTSSVYPADEAFFLHCIIETIHEALKGHSRLDSERFAAWVAERHAQIGRSELVLIVHQLDFVGEVSHPGDRPSKHT